MTNRRERRAKGIKYRGAGLQKLMRTWRVQGIKSKLMGKVSDDTNPPVETSGPSTSPLEPQ